MISINHSWLPSIFFFYKFDKKLKFIILSFKLAFKINNLLKKKFIKKKKKKFGKLLSIIKDKKK
jgi:hypothetical protein